MHPVSHWRKSQAGQNKAVIESLLRFRPHRNPIGPVPVMIHQSRSRLSLHAADWNGDRAPDVFVITGQRVALFRNKAIEDRCEFEQPETLPLPPTVGGFYGVSPVDLNADGDIDLVYHTSSRITCWVERSFLKHGYRTARLVQAGFRQSR